MELAAADVLRFDVIHLTQTGEHARHFGHKQVITIVHDLIMLTVNHTTRERLVDAQCLPVDRN